MSPATSALKLRMIIIINIILLGAAGGAARPDRRDFIRAYQYATQPEGNLEVEIWNDVDAPATGGFDQAVVTPRVELEYGITDHWDIALYHLLEQPPPEGRWTGWSTSRPSGPPPSPSRGSWRRS